MENNETNGKDGQSESSVGVGCESSSLSMVDIDCYTVNMIELCLRSRTLLVAGTCHVIVYQFSTAEETLELVVIKFSVLYLPYWSRKYNIIWRKEKVFCYWASEDLICKLPRMVHVLSCHDSGNKHEIWQHEHEAIVASHKLKHAGVLLSWLYDNFKFQIKWRWQVYSFVHLEWNFYVQDMRCTGR